MRALGARGPSPILGAPTQCLTDACYASAAPEERWGRRSEFDSRRPDIICEKRFGAFCVGAPRIGREGVGKREFLVEEGSERSESRKTVGFREVKCPGTGSKIFHLIRLLLQFDLVC